MRTRLVIAALVLLAACSQHAGQPAASTSAPAPAASRKANTSYVIKATRVGGRPVVITSLSNGQPQYELRASSVFYTTSLQRGTFKDNTLFFYKGHTTRLTVTAPTATVDEAHQQVFLTDGVLARAPTGESLRADQMQYDARSAQLVGTGHVVLDDGKGDKLTGERAVADLDLEQVNLFGNIGVKQLAH